MEGQYASAYAGARQTYSQGRARLDAIQAVSAPFFLHLFTTTFSVMTRLSQVYTSPVSCLQASMYTASLAASHAARDASCEVSAVIESMHRPTVCRLYPNPPCLFLVV